MTSTQSCYFAQSMKTVFGQKSGYKAPNMYVSVIALALRDLHCDGLGVELNHPRLLASY